MKQLLLVLFAFFISFLSRANSFDRFNNDNPPVLVKRLASGLPDRPAPKPVPRKTISALHRYASSVFGLESDKTPRVEDPLSLSAIAPLPFPRPLPVTKLLSPDPIRFFMLANKTQLSPGEEVELTIIAELLPILPSQLFFFENQKSFSLRLLTPEGFVQTGGNYYDFISHSFNNSANNRIEYTIRGFFGSVKGSQVFTLLRGPAQGGATSFFEKKGQLQIDLIDSNPLYTAQARISADSSCQLMNWPINLIYGKTPTNQFTVSVSVADSLIADSTQAIEFSVDSLTFTSNPLINLNNQQGFVFIRRKNDTTCYRKIGYDLTGFSPIPIAGTNSANPCDGPQSIWLYPDRLDICNDDGTLPAGYSDVAKLSVPGCGSSPVKWFKNNLPISGQNSINLFVYDTGKYYAQCNPNACRGNEAISNEVEITLKCPVYLTAGKTKVCGNELTSLTVYGCPIGGVRFKNINSGYEWCRTITTSGSTTFTGIESATYTVRCITPLTLTNQCDGTQFTSDWSNEVTITKDCGSVDPCAGNTPATPTITGTLSFCPGNPTTLTASCSTGSPVWSTGATTNSIVVSTATTYSVYCTNGSCNSSSASVNVTQKPSGECEGNPEPSTGCTKPDGGTYPADQRIDGPANQQACTNSSVSLTAANCNDGATITWSNGTTGGTNTITTPPTAGDYTYSFTCRYTSSCERTVSYTLHVSSCGPTDPCAGPANYQGDVNEINCTRFRGWVVNHACGEQLNQVRILIDGQLVATVSTTKPREDVRQIIMGRTSGFDQYGFDWEVPSQYRSGLHTVTITYINGNPLPNGSSSFGMNLSASSNSPAGQVYAEGTLNLTAVTQGAPASSYNWSGPNNFTSQLPNPSIPYATTLLTGTYSVVATTTDGCSTVASTPVVITSGNYLGTVDYIRCDSLAGWIFDQHHAGASGRVTIVVDGQPVETILADIPRPDVRDHYQLGTTFANYGYRWAIPTHLRNSGIHEIRIYATNTGQQIHPEPYYLGIQPPTPVTFNGGSGTTFCQGTAVTLATTCSSGQMSWTYVSGPQPGAGAVAASSSIIQPGNYPAGTYQYAVQCTSPDGCSSASVAATLQITPKPIFSFSAKGSGPAVSSATSANGPTSLTVDICNGGTITLSNLSWPGPSIRLYEHLRSNGNIIGIPPNRSVNDLDVLNAQSIFSNSHGPFTLSNPATEGVIQQTFYPYIDTNGNNHYDAGIDCDGDSIVLVYRVLPKPILGFTATTAGPAISVGNSTGPAVTNLTVCSGGLLTISNLQRNRPDVGMLEKMFSSGNVIIQGILTPTDRPEQNFSPAITAVIANMAHGPFTTSDGAVGTAEQWFTPYIDSNGNGQYDQGECLGDRITLKYTISPLPTVTPKVRIYPSVSLLESTQYTVCEGDTLAFDMDRDPANSPGYAMRWSGPNGTQGPLINSLSDKWTINNIQPTQSGNYTYTVNNAQGCTNSATVSVVVNPPSYVGNLEALNCSLLGGWIVNTNCPEKSIDLYIYINDELVTISPANTPRPDVREFVFNTTTPGFNTYGFNWTIPENYRVGHFSMAVKDKQGRILFGPATYSIPPSPTVYANVRGTTSLSVCPNSSINLTAEGCGAALNWYKLESDGALTYLNTVTPGVPTSFTVGTSTSYVARCHGSAPGCPDSENSETITVYTQPNPPSVHISGSSATSLSVCSGTSFNLTAEGCHTALNWYKVEASGVLTILSTVSPGVSTSFTASETTSYVARCHGYAAGCSDSENSQTITVYAESVLPADPTFNGSTSLSVCQGTAVSFASSCPSGQVHWKRYDAPNGNIMGEATMNPLPFGPENSAGTYYYSVECISTGCSGQPKAFTFTVTPKPVFGFSAKGSGPAVSSATSANGPTSLTVDICNGGTITLSNLSWPGPSIRLYEHLRSNGNIIGIPPNRSVNDLDVLNAQSIFSNSHGPFTLSNPATEGVIQQTFYPYIDTNGNNHYDAGIDCDGDSIVLVYRVLPKPILGFTATTAGPAISVGNSTGPAVTNLTVCSGGLLTISNLQRNRPDVGMLEKMFSSGNVIIQGILTPTDRPEQNFSPAITAVIGNMAHGPFTTSDGAIGTAEQWFTPYIDSNGNGQYDQGECLGDRITLKYTIQPLAKPTSVSANPSAISSPRSVTLSASGCANTTKWEWSSGTATGATLVTTVNQTTTFGVRCVNSAGCQSDTVAITVQLLNLPAPIIGTSKLSICGSDTVTLRANGCPAGSTVLWSNGMTGTSIVFTPTATTTYYAICQIDAAQGPQSNNLSVSVRPLPTITGTRSYTTGQTVSLTATATGASSYSWKGPGGYTSTGAELRILGATTSSTAGSYTVTANYTGGGCSPYSVVVITVNGPALQTGSLTQTSVCQGAVLSVPFSTTGDFGGSNSFTIQLSDMGGNFANPVTIGSGSASPISVTIPTGTIAGSGYRLRVMSSDPLAEGTLSPTILTVTAPPSLSASNNSPAGQASLGDTLRLTTTGQNLIDATYQWNGPNGYTSTVANPVIPNSTTAHSGTYTVTVTTPGGCTATAQTSVSMTTVCTLLFEGEPVVECDPAAPVSTNQGSITVKLANVPVGGEAHISLYQQSTVTSEYSLLTTVSSTTTAFTGLADGLYQVDGYVVVGAQTCRTDKRTLTIRCTSEPPSIRIKALDATPKETDKLPRINGILGTLQLSVEGLDGEDLTGYTYLWTEPTATSATASTATSATLTASRIGEYKVTLTRGNEILEAYITISALPCTERNAVYSECKTVTITNPSAVNTLSNLAPGDIFYAGDYKIEVTQATGSGGGWTGEGTVDVTLINGFALPAQVAFTNIQLNDCYELIGGSVVTKYDPSWSNVIEVGGFLKDMNEVFRQTDNLLKDYKGTPTEIASIQNSLVPLLTPYNDVTQVADLIQKIEDLTNQCTSANGELSTDCKDKITAIQTAYEELRQVIDGLPPLPEDLLNLTSNSPNARAAANDVPTVTIVQLDQVANNGCATRTGCATSSGPIIRYYGQAYLQGNEFWLVEENAKKYFIWRTSYLDQVIYGYLPYEATKGNYVIYSPEPGKTAGAAFADAGQKLTFEIAVVLATAGLGEGVTSELTDSFVNAVAQSNGNPDELVRNLADELLFAGLSYVPDALGSTQMKRLLAFYKPDFSNYIQNANGKLNLISSWIGDAYAKAKTLTGTKLNEYRSFFKKVGRTNLSAVYDGVVRFGGKYDGRLRAFFDATGAKIATVKKVGDDYVLIAEPDRLITNPSTSAPVLEELGSIKYQKVDGSQTDGGLVLVDVCGLTSSGGRVAAGDCPDQKKLAFKALNSFIKFSSPNSWRDFLDVNKCCLPATWTSYLSRAGQSFNDVSTKLQNKLISEKADIVNKFGKNGFLPLNIDCFGFPDFMPFVNQAINVATGGAVLCMVEIDNMVGTGNDYPKANELLSKKLGFNTTQNFVGPGPNYSFGDGITYTWHHHQDGRTMMLIPAAINQGKGELVHIGANALIQQNLGRGAFPDPITTQTRFMSCN